MGRFIILPTCDVEQCEDVWMFSRWNESFTRLVLIKSVSSFEFMHMFFGGIDFLNSIVLWNPVIKLSKSKILSLVIRIWLIRQTAIVVSPYV